MYLAEGKKKRLLRGTPYQKYKAFVLLSEAFDSYTLINISKIKIFFNIKNLILL